MASEEEKRSKTTYTVTTSRRCILPPPAGGATNGNGKGMGKGKRKHWDRRHGRGNTRRYIMLKAPITMHELASEANRDLHEPHLYFSPAQTTHARTHACLGRLTIASARATVGRGGLFDGISSAR